MIFYEIGWNIVRNGGLKKNKYYSVEKNVFGRIIMFRDAIYKVNWTSAQSFSCKFVI